MENMSSCGYRIERSTGRNDVWVYRDRTRLMHLIPGSKETDQELMRSVKEIVRILDL